MKCHLILVAVAAASVGGCASHKRVAGKPMVFVSTPPGATVTTTKSYSCPSTPCSILIDRNDGFDATFTLAGYQPQTVPVRKLLVPTEATAKIGVGIGIIGLGSGTGAGVGYGKELTAELGPNPVIVTLEPEKLPPPPRRRLQTAPPPMVDPRSLPRPEPVVREGDPASAQQSVPADLRGRR